MYDNGNDNSVNNPNGVDCVQESDTKNQSVDIEQKESVDYNDINEDNDDINEHNDDINEVNDDINQENDDINEEKDDINEDNDDQKENISRTTIWRRKLTRGD